MQTITMYRYVRADGGTTVSFTKPDVEYTETYRLVADEGRLMTDGTEYTICVDTDVISNWIEVDDINNFAEDMRATIQTKAYAYDVITGVIDQ